MDFTTLLHRHDDPNRWEYPRGFDYAAATRRFTEFTEALRSALGVSLKSESGSAIQDASFHSQIFPPFGEERHTAIRFSNFGDMATISEEVPVPPELVKVVIALLEKLGYVYVPASVLDQPYTGKNPGVTGMRTWWIRYFDWV